MKNIVLPLTALVSILVLQCTGPKETSPEKVRTPMVICFDVEDYTSPASVGMDDIPKWLAEIMTEEGVTGSFFVIGEKARMMEERGRQDVISAMSRHDIGSHTNLGSIHPTVTEILENEEWEEGVQHMLENESAGMDELEGIFGQRPANLARHGGSYGPQLVAALGYLNAGYVYSPISLPDHNAVWFCNTLNFHGEGDFGFFDDTYYRDDLFNPLLEALDSLIPASIQNIDVVAFFACHPSKVRSVQFWDFNYYKGANPGPDEWQTPELRPLESMETAKKNFRRLVRYLRDRDDIELTTFRELARRYAYQREEINADELAEIAARVLDDEKVVIDEYYSPAEIFCALADAICQAGSENSIPPTVEIRRPLGPLETPPQEPEIRQVPSDEVIRLAREGQKFCEASGHLPAFLLYEGKKIGTGTLLALFSDYYLRMDQKTIPDQLELLSMEPFPSQHTEQIISEVAACKTWPVHREDLDMDHLVEMTRLQLWTLKPALPVEN
ncbi:MAG: hypothetical protein ACWGNV_13750 [Bacteroidales bacterium]